MDFSIVEELRLKDAFSELKVFREVNSQQDYYNVLIEYSNRSKIFVCDSEEIGHSIFLEDTNGVGNNKIFVLENPSRKEIFLMHIDGVLFAKDTKCDCAIISAKELDFIEFKSNAINRTDEAIESNYEKASSQLLNTVEEFRKRYYVIGLSMEAMRKLECYAVFNRTVPGNSAYQKKVAAKFLRDSKGVKLKFENGKIVR